MPPLVTRPAVGTWRRVVGRAVLAPSVHNTQPWRFAVRDGALEIIADRSRQLHVLDPQARQLFISVGCAVLNARVALADAGIAVTVDRRRDRSRPELVVRLLATGGAADPTLARLADAVVARHTNRRRFLENVVDPAFVATLIATARLEDAALVPVLEPKHRLAVARLSTLADEHELADPGYRAELRRWTTDDPRRDDGVPAFAVPHVDGTAEDEIPLRDFDTAGMGWLPGDTHNSSDGCLLLLTTERDDPAAWTRAGEALERVLLELTLQGYASSPLTQVIEVAHTREALRGELELAGHPQLLLRVGRAPAVSATRRRPLTDVFTVVS